MECCEKAIIRHRFKPGMMIGVVVLLSVITVSSAGYTFTVPIPFLTFKKATQPIVPVQIQGHSQDLKGHHHDHDIHQHHHHHKDNPHHLDIAHDHHHHHHHDHGHLDQSGKLYLHGDSTVKFYYKENMHGKLLKGFKKSKLKTEIFF